LAERQLNLEKKPKTLPQIVVENQENAELMVQSTRPSGMKISVKDPQQHQHSVVNQPKKSLVTRSNIEFKVNALKVVELRMELRNRGYDTQGLKKDLRSRLLDAMLVELEAEDSLQIPLALVSIKMPQATTAAVVTSSENLQQTSSSEKIVGDSTGGDDAMQVGTSTSKSQGAKKMSIELRHPDNSKKMSLELSQPTKKSSIEPKRQVIRHSEQHNRGESISSMQVEHHGTTTDEQNVITIEGKDSSMGVQTATAMAILRSPAPNSQAKESVPSTSRVQKVSTESSPRVFKPISEKKVEKNPSVVKDDGKTSVSSQISADDNSRTNSEACTSISKESGKMVKDMISKFSGQASLSSTLSSSSSSAVSKEMKKIKEARMAKIAEMREKVCVSCIHMKPFFVRTVHSPNLYCASPLQSKTKLASNICITTKDPSNVQPSSHKKGPVTSESARKDRLAAQMREKAATHKKPFVGSTSMLVSSSTHKNHLHFSGSVQNSLGTTLKLPSVTKVAKPKPPSPMDTYEISDREGSDDSDSEAENDNKQKKIPTWAGRAHLVKALEEQYHGQLGGTRVDPDDIFHEVQSCDLVAIFGHKKADKYRSRNSSGNWMRDQVTAAEKLVYKREMGFSIPNERVESEI
jgi:hypothetical protein